MNDSAFFSRVFFFLGFNALMSCTNSSNANNEQILDKSNGQKISIAIDSVTIITSTNSSVSLYYIDSLHFGHPLFAKEKKYIFRTNTPIWLLEADDNQTPFLVFPGETIQLTKFKKNISQLTINGDEKRNNELLFFPKLIDFSGGLREGFKLKKYQSKVTNIKEFFKYVDTIKNKKESRNNFLNEYTLDNPVNNYFITKTKNIIDRIALKDFLLLCNSNRDLLSKAGLFNKYIDSCIITTNRDSQDIDFVFKDLAIIEANVLMGKRYYNEIEVADINSLKISFETIKKSFSGQVCDYLLSAYLFRALNKNLGIPKEMMLDYFSICNDVSYEFSINKKLLEITKNYSFKTENIIQDMAGNYFDLDSIIIANKDSVILIDFWASWCAPCRAEMPYSKNLSEKNKNEPVRFIYLSIDKNVDDWIRACKEDQLVNRNSFLLVNVENSKLNKNYKIEAIPRYMLIGPNGKVINTDAPKPSSKDLELLINKYFSFKRK